jgi:hypothetical protein
MKDIVKWIYKSIKTIALSRINKKPKEQYITNRRVLCSKCNFNSKNQENLSIKVRLLILLSDFYTWITFNKKTELGSCAHPRCGCDIYYKTQEEEEKCPIGFWSIYIPNSTNIKKGKKWKY